MERSNPLPPLVRPSDISPANDALLVAGRRDGREAGASPFACVKWRLVLDGSHQSEPPRRPYAGA